VGVLVVTLCVDDVVHKLVVEVVGRIEDEETDVDDVRVVGLGRRVVDILVVGLIVVVGFLSVVVIGLVVDEVCGIAVEVLGTAVGCVVGFPLTS